MSIATKNAVFALLTGDATLTGLVAALPVPPYPANTPAIVPGNRDQAPPVYPSVTYRVTAASPDKRFRPPLNVGGPSTVDDEYLALEVWSQSQDSAVIETIAARIAALLDGQGLASANVFRAELVTDQPDLYDAVLKGYYGVYQYRLRIALS